MYSPQWNQHILRALYHSLSFLAITDGEHHLSNGHRAGICMRVSNQESIWRYVICWNVILLRIR